MTRKPAPRRQRRSGGLLTTARWKKLVLLVIQQEPLCKLRLIGCTRFSQTADHIIPVSHRPDLRYLRSNLRGSCHHCNMRRGNRPLSEVRAEDALRQGKSADKPAAALEFFS